MTNTTPPTSPTHACPHPALDDLWDNDALTWDMPPASLCDDCLQELHDATCGCDDRIHPDGDMPVVGRDEIIAHIDGATIGEAHDSRMDYCIDCERDYDSMSAAERALHVCQGEMILRTCKNNPNTL